VKRVKIKVYYDGNPANTQVVDAETGEMIDGIVSAHVDIDAFEARATLVFADFEADIKQVEVSDEDPEWLHRAGSDRDNRQDIDETSEQV
jgi:hypothetical protein